MTNGTKPGATVPLADILADFSAEDQAEIRMQADRLIQESRTLAQFRREMGMTQAELADALETSQAYVAKLEGKPTADMQVSTIARIAAALGGEVKVVVSLPGRPDATLSIPPAIKGRKSVRRKTKADTDAKMRSASS
ncbi:helix-turn-helix domain-containing protein [Methylobacterium oryzisoli]|uniref:helix-turn-helix domain-containing protein n=1 Tax=Methylobacterium oryzisoli TaxID=3385502 RepID=UPI003891208F